MTEPSIFWDENLSEPIEHILWSDYVFTPLEEETEYTAADYADDYGDEPGID